MPALESLAERYPQIQFVFLYTREAHPAQTIPAHQSFADKLACAQRLAQRWKMKRRVLVDALDGPLHLAYGGLPNMSWIVDSRGKIVYKASWTDAVTIEIAVRQLLVEADAKASGAQQIPYNVEWRPQRRRDFDGFMRGLLENGPRAVHEFIDSLETTYGESSARMHRAWRDEHMDADG